MRQSDTQLRTATKNREEAAARVRCVVCVCGVNVALASFALAAFAVKIGKGVCNDTLLH